MAAVAARTQVTRTNAARKSTAARSTGTIRRVRVKPRKNARFSLRTGIILSAAGIVLLFGYINVYANLTTTGYSRSRLDDLCRQARIQNQRLKVEVTKLSSPRNVVAAAKKAGMVYATQYDYLPKTEHVASVGPQSTGDNQ